jgi:hypothetical protein
MSLQVIEGDKGSGKSYMVVNGFMADYLMDTERPVYTNLPLRLDNYIASLTRNVARQSKIRDRLVMVEERMSPVSDDIWLAWVKGACGACLGEEPPTVIVIGKTRVEIGDIISPELWALWKEEARSQMRKGFVVEPDPHCVDLLKEGRIRNTLREFWWFLPENSVVFMDECADLWNAKNTEDRPGTLSTFINHERHYRLDIFVLCQSRADIDNQVRNKFNYVWIVTNSLTQKIGEHWLLVGMKWPVQFFKAVQYTGRHVSGKGGDLRRFEAAGAPRTIWSSQGGFRNYHSHSAAGSLPGLKTPGDAATSDDLRTPWQQVKPWVERLWLPVGYFGGLIVGAIVMWKLLFGFMDATKGVVHVDQGKKPAGVVAVAQAKPLGTNEVKLPPVVLAAGSKSNETQTATSKKRVGRLVSSGGVAFDGRRYSLGDKCAGSVIARFWSGGVVLADGRSLPWSVLP